MKARIYKESDHAVLASWWKEQNWPVIEKAILPEDGFIISADKDICAGFLYKAVGCPIGWVEWIIADPNSTAETRDKALDFLLQTLVKEAKDCGLKALFTSSNKARLIDRYKKHSFFITDTDTTILVRGL